tara:strand:+ start:11064 stop:11843 length:780 start_codon:yes stop_codon:yes gene_type:complete
MKMSSPRFFWFVQIVLLVGTAIWTFLDPRSIAILGPFPISDSQWFYSSWIDKFGIWRCVAGVFVLAMCALTGLRLTYGLFGSSSDFRSLKALIVLMTLSALWCGLVLQFPSIAWQGKRARVFLCLDEFESIASPLRADWPRRDGMIEPIGPFMAYPFGRPSVLVLLTPPSVFDHGTSISAIERSERGALRFQLSGIEGGDWAEWHPPHSQPASFTGGLNDHYRLSSHLPLGNGWYLVRYDAPATKPLMTPSGLYSSLSP